MMINYNTNRFKSTYFFFLLLFKKILQMCFCFKSKILFGFYILSSFNYLYPYLYSFVFHDAFIHSQKK